MRFRPIESPDGPDAPRGACLSTRSRRRPLPRRRPRASVLDPVAALLSRVFPARQNDGHKTHSRGGPVGRDGPRARASSGGRTRFSEGIMMAEDDLYSGSASPSAASGTRSGNGYWLDPRAQLAYLRGEWRLMFRPGTVAADALAGIAVAL